MEDELKKGPPGGEVSVQMTVRECAPTSTHLLLDSSSLLLLLLEKAICHFGSGAGKEEGKEASEQMLNDVYGY